MAYTFTHRVVFRSGEETLPYRSTRFWKTVRGALNAAEAHARGVSVYYANILQHSIVVLDEHGRFVTNLAA